MKNYIEVGEHPRSVQFQNTSNIYGLTYSKQTSIFRLFPCFTC